MAAQWRRHTRPPKTWQRTVRWHHRQQLPLQCNAWCVPGAELSGGAKQRSSPMPPSSTFAHGLYLKQQLDAGHRLWRTKVLHHFGIKISCTLNLAESCRILQNLVETFIILQRSTKFYIIWWNHQDWWIFRWIYAVSCGLRHILKVCSVWFLHFT